MEVDGWHWRVLTTSLAATAAKSLQLCLTLCDPIDSSPPGSPVPGIFQARVLEWGAIAFSVSAWHPRCPHPPPQEKELYLLDDPLAAVDADVATHLLHRCILGALSHTTRLLCTHRTEYLVGAQNK